MDSTFIRQAPSSSLRDDNNRPSVASRSNLILQESLAKLSHLDLTGKISNTSPVLKAHGGYCDVFVGTYSSRSEHESEHVIKVAVKRLRVHVLGDRKFQKVLAKEMSIWSNLRHAHVLPLLGYFFEDNNYPSLVSKWMENGTALKYIKAHPNCDLPKMVLGIALGLEYLHSKNVIHSDIKPDNILISFSGHPLICDFGISRMLATSRMSSSLTGDLKGTLRYMAVELLKVGSDDQLLITHSKESDVWAFGMTVLELFTTEPPYSHIKRDLAVLPAIMKGDIPRLPEEFLAKDALNLLFMQLCQKCWKLNPNDRPTIHEIVADVREALEQDLSENYGGDSCSRESTHLMSATSPVSMTEVIYPDKGTDTDAQLGMVEGNVKSNDVPRILVGDTVESDDVVSCSPHNKLSSTTSLPPLLPPRSPFRPSSRNNASKFNNNSFRKSSVPSPSVLLLDQYFLNSKIGPPAPVSDTLIPGFSLSREKPLPVPPDEDRHFTSLTAIISTSADTSETSMASIPSTATVPAITKREQVLKDLLSTERAYASDLTFIQNVHIPLALGKSAPFHLPRPATPPRSSGSSSRTLSTSSDSSFTSRNGPPMTKDDVRLIFSNITELAIFSDMFSQRLEEALGGVLEDGRGEDCVGALFLEIIPQLEPPYKTYITKHPNALKHLSSLPQTPALTSYLAHTQSLASSVTRAWDLPSLLIKPVQRLLQYSFLLSTIMEQTPDGHGDKKNLIKARDRMEDVVRRMNENLRRMEVVKDVLTGKADIEKSVALFKKLSIGKPSQIRFGRMRMDSMGMGMGSVRLKEANNEESARVAQYDRQLTKCRAFLRKFAKDIVGWAQAVRASQAHLRAWAVYFGKTVGVNEEQPSETFNAFLGVIDVQLIPLCQKLDEVVAKELLPELAGLLDTSKAPTRLLTAMHSLEPLHSSLLNLNDSKDRPLSTMLEASHNYLALRGQLASDLPKYLELLDKGIVMCIRQFARRQTDFLNSVHDQWRTLWDCLRMKGETNAGCEETLALWWNRYSEVEDKIDKLTLLKRGKPPLKHHRSGPSGSVYQPSDIRSMELPLTPPPNSPSFFLYSSSRHRSFGSPSLESIPSLSLSQLAKSRSRTPEITGPSKARANIFTSPAPSSSSALNLLGVSNTSSPSRTSLEYADSTDFRSDGRGYKSRSRGSSLSRKLSETVRKPFHRSPSQKSVASQRSQRSCTSSDGFGHSSKLNLGNSSASSLPHHADHIDIMPSPNSPTLYYVTAVHTCSPPGWAIYMYLPFLELQVGDIFGVLSELGHPSKHKGMCMDVDEGDEDCLLVVKDEGGKVGLALASFLVSSS